MHVSAAATKNVNVHGTMLVALHAPRFSDAPMPRCPNSPGPRCFAPMRQLLGLEVCSVPVQAHKTGKRSPYLDLGNGERQ